MYIQGEWYQSVLKDVISSEKRTSGGVIQPQIPKDFKFVTTKEDERDDYM